MVTCEHASNCVPAWARALVEGSLSAPGRRRWQQALATHRGFDDGAAAVAQALAAARKAPCLLGRFTRLLVDLNRSPAHPARWSEFTRHLPKAAHWSLHRRLWFPHWQAVADVVRAARPSARRPLYHAALHSFDPTLRRGRECIDIGLLYDPARPLERAWVAAVRASIAERLAPVRVRRNAPYRGVADGLPTALRKRVAPAAYAGIEIEVNQSLVHSARWPQLSLMLADAIARATPRP